MKDFDQSKTISRRLPETVMRLSRMGQAFPTRLSFLPALLRRLKKSAAKVSRDIWHINSQGYGHALYSISVDGYVYSLIVVSSLIDDAQRTDRVIADVWDSAFVLYDGIPTSDEIVRIVRDAPKQEAARFTNRDLILSRANKSVRLFDHVIECLRKNSQPDPLHVRNTGYLMRTTAVYGNGKFGIADQKRIADRPVLSGPFMAEMLTIWLIRGFSHDLVEHLGGAKLNRKLKRHLGVGNATGLGMAPFLVNHPILLNAWVHARETALGRVRRLAKISNSEVGQIQKLSQRVAIYLNEWQVSDDKAMREIILLRQEWEEFARNLTDRILIGSEPINSLWEIAQSKSVSLQELVAAFLIEPFGYLVDDLVDDMAVNSHLWFQPEMPITQLKEALFRNWDWCLDIDFLNPENEGQFWYVSKSKLEPRLGIRYQDAGSELELPLDIARQVQAMASALDDHNEDLLAFLRKFPQHRSAVRRVQTLSQFPYAEIRDNLISQYCRPIDLLRFKLAFLGAAKFDPKSDRWTRVTLAQGAPLFDELEAEPDCWLSVLDLP
ncbi:MAG: hypothetical protein OXC62_06540 [Aestuariivita sp.]|nr:hypothetical protein [Aestuariivita sp.]